MAQIPGFQTGIAVKHYSSMNEKVLGKLTDRNHLQSVLRNTKPAEYDKKIISLWSQTAQNSSDFHQMLLNSKPFEIPKGKSDTFTWEVTTSYKYPKIVAVPDSTRSQSQIGRDGQEFELVFDKPEFYKGEVITPSFTSGVEIYITSDPKPYTGGSAIYTCLYVASATTDYLDKQWIAEGKEYIALRNLAGEFSLGGSGLRGMGDKIQLMESLGVGARKEHMVTGWADAQGIDPDQEIVVYQQYRRNETGEITKAPATWEPFIEKKLRDELMAEMTRSAIWSRGGVVAGENGWKQESLKYNTGLYWKMKENGNYTTFNKGEFSKNYLRSIFGDLFDRRVAMENRRVKIFANQAGINLFEEAAKRDAMGTGIQFVDGGNGNSWIQGTGRNRMLYYGFDRMHAPETGVMSISHLSELDQAGPNSDFEQAYHRKPRFMVFNITPESDGMPYDNIRLIRRAGVPNFQWGYVDGLTSHLGPMASQGHQMAHGGNWYTIHYETRWDVHIEDASKCVLIEQN